MASVLQTIVEKKHYAFVDKLDSWQQGVELSAKSLVADGSVDEDYYKQIVDCIEKYGPYVVFDHYVAMPHSQENAQGVHKTGVAFMLGVGGNDFALGHGISSSKFLFRAMPVGNRLFTQRAVGVFGRPRKRFADPSIIVSDFFPFVNG